MAEFTVCIKDAEGTEIEAYELDFDGDPRLLDRAVYDALCNELHMYHCEFCNKLGPRDEIEGDEDDGCVSCPKCVGK